MADQPPVVGDADEIGAVHARVWRETYADLMPATFLAERTPERLASTWRRRLDAPPAADRDGIGLIARAAVDGRLLGFAAGGPARDPDPPTVWELQVINLLSEAHGTGLADVLVDRVVGDRPAYLWVVQGNVRAIAFYRRRGFITDGATTIHPASGATELRMINDGCHPSRSPATRKTR